MLYIDFDDHSIEVIQTDKSIVGGEKIIACSRKEIPEGIIINGLIVDTEKLESAFKEILAVAYPKAIKDQQVSLSISDKQVFTHHFHFNEKAANFNLSERIITEAKNILPYDPGELVNFYKVLAGTPAETDVIYTASAKNTVVHFDKFFKSIGVSLIYLFPRSSAVFEWLKHMFGENEYIIYSTVDKKNADYLVFDKFGLVSAIYKKLGGKSFIIETSTVISEVEKEKSIKISKLIVAGLDSIELHTTEVFDSLNIPVIKLSEINDTILKKFKIKFDTGGMPKMLFIHSLSSWLLKKSESPPNFASDLDKIPDIITENKISAEKQTVTSSESHQSDSVANFDFGLNQAEIPDQRNRSKIIYRKLIIGLIVFLTAIIVFLGIYMFIGRNMQFKLPNIAKPTITPVPSVVPSATPIPTIDPTLKRTDLKISIQNGTQKAGFAKDIAKILENKGYKNIAKSNADRDSYDKTIVKIKDGKKPYLPLLTSDFKDQFDMTTLETLEDSNPFDLVIILGNK